MLSDQWLGILESATFPTTEVEMKQQNLSLGGSRNFTYQYKNTSFTGGNLGLVANHGAFLYYFLENAQPLTCSTDALATALSTDAHRHKTLAHGSSDNNSFLIRSMDAGTSEVTAGDDVVIAGIVETGPIFRRTVGNKICPITPFEATDAQLDFYHKLDRPTGSTTLTKAITYTFDEQDGDLLPSFH